MSRSSSKKPATGLALTAALAACGGTAPAPSRADAPTSPRCTMAALLAFDPAMPVAKRRALAPATRTSAAHTERVAIVACREEEEEVACRARAEREMRAAYPDAVSLASFADVERLHVRARFAVDGVTEERTFESIAALTAHLEGLAALGRTVVIISSEAVAAPDAARRVVVRASTAKRTAGDEALRVELVVRPPADRVVALGTLQRRALAARVVIHTFEPADDGTLHVEIGCVRPL